MGCGNFCRRTAANRRGSNRGPHYHQQLTQTAEGDAKMIALQVANQSNNDNLEILAQIIQAEKNYRQQRDGDLDNWVRGWNKDISELKGDTILTKE